MLFLAIDFGAFGRSPQDSRLGASVSRLTYAGCWSPILNNGPLEVLSPQSHYSRGYLPSGVELENKSYMHEWDFALKMGLKRKFGMCKILHAQNQFYANWNTVYYHLSIPSLPPNLAHKLGTWLPSTDPTAATKFCHDEPSQHQQKFMRYDRV